MVAALDLVCSKLLFCKLPLQRQPRVSFGITMVKILRSSLTRSIWPSNQFFMKNYAKSYNPINNLWTWYLWKTHHKCISKGHVQGVGSLNHYYVYMYTSLYALGLYGCFDNGRWMWNEVYCRMLVACWMELWLVMSLVW
jgi:hypothetical protein